MEIGLTEILAGVFGALAVGGIDLLKRWLDDRRRRRAVLHAFVAEISGIAAIVRAHEYVAYIKAVLDEMDKTKEPQRAMIDIRSDYLTIYSALASEIGILEPRAAAAIARFYIAVKSATDLTSPDSPAADDDDFETVRSNNLSAVAAMEALLVLADHVTAFAPSAGEAIAEEQQSRLGC